MTALELAYVGLNVRDRPAVERILSEVVGLVPASPSAGVSSWRNDDRVHRVLLHAGEFDDIAFFALEAREEHFDGVLERLRSYGADVHPGAEAQAMGRRVRRLVHVTTPWGVPLEVVCGLEHDEAGAPSTPVVPGGFRTGDLGFGHVVFATDRLAASDEFLRLGLGFAQTDWLELEFPGGALIVRFYHCNRRHHTVALAGMAAPGGRRLDHFMVEASEVDDVRTAYRRAIDAGYAMTRSLGKHENDQIESFYVAIPSGFSIELGAGGRLVDAPWKGNVVYRQISVAGHEPVKAK
jgi:biphenyl-2,3-diol 1,2-dioxygenase